MIFPEAQNRKGTESVLVTMAMVSGDHGNEQCVVAIVMEEAVI